MGRNRKGDPLKAAWRAARRAPDAAQRRALARQVRAARDLMRLAKDVQRETERADHALRQLGFWLMARGEQVRVGEYVRVRELLTMTQQLQTGEDVYGAVSRLIGIARRRLPVLAPKGAPGPTSTAERA